MKHKNKINTDIIHSRFQRSDGAIATLKAHDLWNDVEVTRKIDFVCTSCKILISIPSSSRGKKRKSEASFPLEEIHVDTVPNPEPIGMSANSGFNYHLILLANFLTISHICEMPETVKVLNLKIKIVKRLFSKSKIIFKPYNFHAIGRKCHHHCY